MPLTRPDGQPLCFVQHHSKSRRLEPIVTSLIRQFRGALVALAILALTAGVAMAGQPASSASGLGVAAQHAGKTVPVVDAEPDEEEDEEEEEVEDAEDAADNCLTDPTGLDEAALAELTHGQIVCWAAHQETPEGYENHGAWVSEWARGDHGAAPDDAGAPDAAADGLSHKGQGKANKP